MRRAPLHCAARAEQSTLRWCSKPRRLQLTHSMLHRPTTWLSVTLQQATGEDVPAKDEPLSKTAIQKAKTKAMAMEAKSLYDDAVSEKVCAETG